MHTPRIGKSPKTTFVKVLDKHVSSRFALFNTQSFGMPSIRDAKPRRSPSGRFKIALACT